MADSIAFSRRVHFHGGSEIEECRLVLDARENTYHQTHLPRKFWLCYWWLHPSRCVFPYGDNLWRSHQSSYLSGALDALHQAEEDDDPGEEQTEGELPVHAADLSGLVQHRTQLQHVLPVEHKENSIGQRIILWTGPRLRNFH